MGADRETQATEHTTSPAFASGDHQGHTAGHHGAVQAAGRAAVQRILKEAEPPRCAPPFPEGKLRPGDRFDGISDEQWMHINSRPLREGPSIIGPLPIRVAGILVARTAFFVWVEGGRIVEWMDAAELPHGGFRRRAWLMTNDGRSLEVIRDRPTDAPTIRRGNPALEGRDLGRRVEAAQELNRDLEHFVATGSTVQHAIKQTQHAHEDVLVELVLGSFRAFSAWTAASEGGAGHLIEALGRTLEGKHAGEHTRARHAP